MFEYVTKGTCARKVSFNVDDNKISDVRFVNGCPGNLIGIRQLVEGMDVNDAIDRLSGIPCGSRPTSCPDQLAKALVKWKEENK